MSHPRLSILAALLPALLVGACAADPGPDENTEKTRDAICSGGGGSGGNSCVEIDGMCPASCSTCFSSKEQKLSLQNLWNCQGTGGGGGSGDLCSSWPASNYSGDGQGVSRNEQESRDQACATATSSASSSCRNSGSYCTGYVHGVPTLTSSCREEWEYNSYKYYCSCTATVSCWYR